MDSHHIKDISLKGIVYLDDEGNERFADFEECYERYLQQRLSPKGIEDYKMLNHKTDSDVLEYIERIKKRRIIGWRNVLGDSIEGKHSGKPYIVFNTDPPLRLDFETEDEFWTIRSTLEEFGWRTHDLT